MLHILIDLLIGIFAGSIAGLLGTGNSLVVLPGLIFMFSRMDLPLSVSLLMAVATNLAICGISILIATVLHNRHNKIDWTILKIIGPAYFIGSLMGPWVAHYLPVHILKIGIAVFIFFAAFTLFLKEKPIIEGYLPTKMNLFGSSLIVAFLSSISGMATGVLIVPYLTWLGVHIRKAISIALPGAVIFSFTAMIGYIITGWGHPNLPKWSMGYVYLPTVIVVSLAAATFAPLGVKLHHQLNIIKLKKIFAFLLIIAGITILSIS